MGNLGEEEIWEEVKTNPIFAGEQRIELISRKIESSERKALELYLDRGRAVEVRMMQGFEENVWGEQVVGRARQYVNQLRLLVGLREVPLEKMMARFSPRDLLEAKGTKAMYSPLSGQVYLPEHEGGLFEVGSAVHEWIHKFLDLHVAVAQNDSSGINYRSFARTGLSVSRYNSREKGRLIGNFVNELPNYYFQEMYMRQELLSHPDIWKDESQFREAVCRKLNKREGDWIVASLLNSEIKLWTGHIYKGTIQGEDIENPHINEYFLFFELASDLALLCNNVDGDPLMLAMLKAKVDPKKQEAVRKVIDSKMGNGYYRRLREVPYPGLDATLVFELISEIQKKTIEEGMIKV